MTTGYHRQPQTNSTLPEAAEGQLTLQVAKDHARQPTMGPYGSRRGTYSRKITANKFPSPCFSQNNLILLLLMATQKHKQAFQAWLSGKITPNLVKISVGFLTVKHMSKSLWAEAAI